MTAPHVLIAYASRNRGTAEIADWIGLTLTAEGVPADVRAAADIQDLCGYTAVVLGSGLYAGRWLRDATRFARGHRVALRAVPVWLFSSGPLDSSAAERDIPPVNGVVKVADELDAVEHATFGGRLVPGAHGLVARMILSRGRGGDFRDRAQVRAWARRIAATAALERPQLI
ncbi:flavodoxin domain-containing protein [Actinacidiphila rubida]|uniref:Menaquinone-dependent protoporphyrinogen oxidase n=1 Tax=Actinacidiphila rubida TaxID=310780 RepID=A0A1H8JCX1_9ACTN|nr:flavodoxin domain-containing protein [Actinacidiphila rubida]SEN78235.1 menaquinone-dependent protoporphyrinogen oxidase [Actinacidiphila rubida]